MATGACKPGQTTSDCTLSNDSSITEGQKAILESLDQCLIVYEMNFADHTLSTISCQPLNTTMPQIVAKGAAVGATGIKHTLMAVQVADARRGARTIMCSIRACSILAANACLWSELSPHCQQ